ncbi:MAG: indole-3-glycerol-phosphate synthase [Desulfovibrio sp.]
MLERFRNAKLSDIEHLKKQSSEGKLPEPYTGERPSFSQHIRDKGKGAVIAEYKRASPSRGPINLEYTPEEIAKAYKDGGAACMSILTETCYFKGDTGYLETMSSAGIPMLRKDFLFHPLQVDETAATKASAMLLVARMHEKPEELQSLIIRASQYGLECVVEIFDRDDLDLARAAGAKIIQVNNRDLQNLSTDLKRSKSFINEKRDGELWISASGIFCGEQVQELGMLGYDAVLVGTSIMESKDPQAAVENLTGAKKLTGARK